MLFFFHICYLCCMVQLDHFVTEPSLVNASICDTLDKAVFLTIVHRRQRELGVAIRHLAPKFDTRQGDFSGHCSHTSSRISLMLVRSLFKCLLTIAYHNGDQVCAQGRCSDISAQRPSPPWQAPGRDHYMCACLGQSPELSIVDHIV